MIGEKVLSNDEMFEVVCAVYEKISDFEQGLRRNGIEPRQYVKLRSAKAKLEPLVHMGKNGEFMISPLK